MAASLDNISGTLTTITRVLGLEGVVEALAAAKGIMPVLGADLELGAIASLPVVVAALLLSTATAAAMVATTRTAAEATIVASRAWPTARRAAIAIKMACSRVGGGVKLRCRGLLLEAEFCVDEVGVEAVEADRCVASGDGGDKRLVVQTKAGEHVAKHLLVA
jgi:hypothetical protein